jgi:hypothetical protein
MSKKHRGGGMASRPQQPMDGLTIHHKEILGRLVPDFLGFKGKTSQDLFNLETRAREFRGELTDHAVSIEAIICLMSDVIGIHRGILVQRYFEYKSDGFPFVGNKSKGKLLVRKYNF